MKTTQLLTFAAALFVGTLLGVAYVDYKAYKAATGS